jgi:hypothetical protein
MKCYQTALHLQPDISHLRQSGQTHKHGRWVEQITSITMASENVLCSMACPSSTPLPQETSAYQMTLLENAIYVLRYTEDVDAEDAVIHFIHMMAKMCDLAQQTIINALAKICRLEWL